MSLVALWRGDGDSRRAEGAFYSIASTHQYLISYVMCEFVLCVVMYPGKINTFIFSKNSVTFNSKNGSYFMLKPVVINSSQKKYFGVN